MLVFIILLVSFPTLTFSTTSLSIIIITCNLSSSSTSLRSLTPADLNKFVRIRQQAILSIVYHCFFLLPVGCFR